jgi:hypothetical protein
MRIVNDGLPEPMFLAVCNDQYSKGESDWTPSSLNQPAYQIALFKKFGDELSESASSRIWSLLGTSVHYMIERAGEMAKAYECERRFYGVVPSQFGPKKIGSQIDILDRSGVLQIFDFKVTSVWSAKGEPKPEWIAQLNVGRWCVWKETGEVVEKLNIVGIWKDFNKREAAKDRSYPQSQCSIIEIPVWSFEKTEAWIRDRVDEREKALELGIDEIEACSEEDAWAKKTTYAIKSAPDAARASKVCDTLAEATAHAKSGQVIEERLGERTRCEGYCPASSHCPAFREYRKLKESPRYFLNNGNGLVEAEGEL